MVQQKSMGWPAASRWTSGREMIRRGYFSERVDLLSVLAHAACHEFAHLIQSVEGKRKHGSVHNSAFYFILDEMHREGVASEVLQLLIEQCRAVGLDASWAKGMGDLGGLHGTLQSLEREGIEAPGGDRRRPDREKIGTKKKSLSWKSAANSCSESAHSDVCPGDAVSFMARGERITGRVRRVNRCTVTIVPDHPERPGQYWRVAPDLFERA